MIDVSEAVPTEIDKLVELEAALFAEDSGRHDPFADITWPSREGKKDFEDLIASPDCILLTAHRSDEVVGLLAGYAQKSSPTLQPVEYAVLRTLYVSDSARREGVATVLTERFLDWARGRGCAEAHVDHYVANSDAAALYERFGFKARSTSRALGL